MPSEARYQMLFLRFNNEYERRLKLNDKGIMIKSNRNENK